MPSPSKRPLAFVAEYECADDNLLTATHQEHVRQRHAERIRNTQSVLKLRDLTLHVIDEPPSPTVNLKKLQLQQDRQGEIQQSNQILLTRLEQIHQRVPKKFDISHHSELLLDALRPSNAEQRRREQDAIARENRKMKRRLQAAKSSCDHKQLAMDADRHYYYSEQISKLTRRQQVQHKCRQMQRKAAAAVSSTVAPHKQDGINTHHRKAGQASHRRSKAAAKKYGVHHADADADADGSDDAHGSDDDAAASDSSTEASRPPPSCSLPPVHSRAVPRQSVAKTAVFACPALTSNSAKVISAADLLRGNSVVRRHHGHDRPHRPPF